MAFTLAPNSEVTTHRSMRQFSSLWTSKVLFVKCSSLPKRALLGAFSFVLCFALIGMALTAPAIAAEKVALSVDASKTGAKIDRNIFGQFAEHLGHGIYEGIWVGPDSAIPNTRGIRNDVVAALKALRVPNVRWPGGCFADEYHWRNGIGPLNQRVVTLNPNWGSVIERNSCTARSERLLAS